jgi:hypothetical protein
MSKKCSSPGCSNWAFEAGLCKVHFSTSKPNKPAGVIHTLAPEAATVLQPVAGGGAAKSLAPHAPPAHPPPSPAPLLLPGPNSVSPHTSEVAKENLKAKPPLDGAFNSLVPPRGEESMLDVCAGFIADAKAGLNDMHERTMSEESGELLLPLLGKPTSLLTKAGVRYEGKLYTVASFHLTVH